MLIADRYRLRDAIGRGAMGEVWRAFDETLDRPVAVKLMLTQDADPTAASASAWRRRPPAASTTRMWSVSVTSASTTTACSW